MTAKRFAAPQRGASGRSGQPSANSEQQLSASLTNQEGHNAAGANREVDRVVTELGVA
jgi:hypothetical protein